MTLLQTIPALPVGDAAFCRDRLGFDVLHHDGRSGAESFIDTDGNLVSFSLRVSA
ncbi:MAG: hypothetical protein ACM33B_02010 [Pseudomonadota bacterium]